MPISYAKFQLDPSSCSAAILDKLTGMHHLTPSTSHTRVKQTKFLSFLDQFDAQSPPLGFS